MDGTTLIRRANVWWLRHTPHTCTLERRKDGHIKGHQEETEPRDKNRREGDSSELGVQRGDGGGKELETKGRALKEIRGGGKEERRKGGRLEKERKSKRVNVQQWSKRAETDTEREGERDRARNRRSFTK